MPDPTDDRHAPRPAGVEPMVDGRARLFPVRSVARWSAGVALVVVLAEVTARILAGATTPEIRWYDAATQVRVEMMSELDDTDVVFAGTSSAWQAFVPSVFTERTGSSAFNAGLAGAVPVVTGRWLVEEVEPRTAPGTVVWGFTALDLAPGYGEEQAEAYDRAVATDDRWLARVDRAVSSVSELVRSRRLFRSVGSVRGAGSLDRARQLDEAREITGPGGERLDFADPAENDLAVQRARLAGFGIDDDDVDAIRSATLALRERGVRVVFVELPVPSRFRDLLTPDEADEVGAVIRSLGADLGVDVVSMRDAFADAAFVDATHLGRTGTSEATALLADGLARLDETAVGTCAPVGATDSFGFELAAEVCRNAP